MPLNFVAIDFETANQERGSICAIGAVKVRDGAIVDEYRSLIKPPKGLDEFDVKNVHTHHITGEDVADAPNFLQVFTGLIISGFISGAGGRPEVLAAHRAFNADVSMLRHACAAYNIQVPPFPWIDTWDVSRKMIAGMSGYSLTKVAKQLGVYEKGHHDPVVDARMSANILLELGRRNGIDDVRGFPSCIREPERLYQVEGRYRLSWR